MITVLQRVDSAKVIVNDVWIAEISKGILCYVSYHHNDTSEEFSWVIKKILGLRVFPSEIQNSRFDCSVIDIQGEILVVSNFTLHGNCQKGLRPDFIEASPPNLAKQQHDLFLELIKSQYSKVSEGEFGAMMKVVSVNDGPVTLIIKRGEKNS